MNGPHLPPPNTPFGHPLRGFWSLDPGIRFLNHGSFGAAPLGMYAAMVTLPLPVEEAGSEDAVRRWRGCSGKVNIRNS